MRFPWYFALVLATLSPAAIAAQRPSQSQSGATPRGVTPSSAGYTVDFNDQDIRVVLSALAEAAGTNVTFSNLPEIRTTLHLGQPVPKDQLLDVMRGVAEQNDLRMTVEGPLVRIAQARSRGENEFAGFQESRPRVELHTYRLKHASAAQMAPLLMNLFAGSSLSDGGAAPGGGAGGNGGQANAPNVPLNFGLGGGGNGNTTTVNMIPSPNGNAAPGAPSCSINGQPADCNQFLSAGSGLNSLLEQALASQAQGQGQRSGRRGRFPRGGGAVADVSQVRVVAEESTNTLLIRSTPQEWEWIQKIIEDVDLRPLQVLIEAVIVEVTRTKGLNVGVDATVNVNRSDRRTIRSGSADLPATPDARDFLLKLAGARGAVDFTAALNALATRGNIRVRSLPVIVGQNNKQAVLNVGSSRPYVQVTQTVAGQPPLQTVSYIDVGTKLQITPRINADGYVNLEVAQTANSATNEIQFDAPVLNRREATTQVFLHDGQTTVIGGLADNTRDHSRSGIPILRSIPVIGGLFGSTHENDIETELYVFLTPHIIAEDTDIDRLRDSLQQQSKELREDPVKPIFPSRSSAAPSPSPAPAPESPKP